MGQEQGPYTSNSEMNPRCTECGMSLVRAGEYHPYAFCVLRKAGLDPWAQLRTMAMQVGLGDPGGRAPLVTETAERPLKAAVSP
jgi:hypothetical protein